MLVLHYAPDNASLIVRLALEEIGMAWRAVLVDRAVRAQEGPAYRALAPTGLIPALETPEGPIFETGAILLWLVDRHGVIGPGAAEAGRGAFLSWLFFLSNTLHADLRQLFYPDRYAPPEAAVARAPLMAARVRAHFGLIDRAAAAAPALFAPPSALALYACTALRWVQLYPAETRGWLSGEEFPTLMQLARALDARPATARAARAEGLGAAPFAAPEPCIPPEGSPY